jgi:hypothetical protein
VGALDGSRARRGRDKAGVRVAEEGPLLQVGPQGGVGGAPRRPGYVDAPLGPQGAQCALALGAGEVAHRQEGVLQGGGQFRAALGQRRSEPGAPGRRVIAEREAPAFQKGALGASRRAS